MVHFLKLRLLVRELIVNAGLAKRLLFEHHDGLGKVLLTEIHLDSICEERLHWHPGLPTFGFLRLHRLHIRI